MCPSPPPSSPDNSPVFWGEISPCEHFVQFYSDEAPFLDTLAGFVGGGLAGDDSGVVIATPSHIQALNTRMRGHGIDIAGAITDSRYIALDAHDILRKFMRNGWPDDGLFKACVQDILRRARANGRSVRAFGEMVALMWADGQCAATVRLEYLWHALCQDEAFSLFCAYPKSGFTEDSSVSIQDICNAHHKVIH